MHIIKSNQNKKYKLLGKLRQKKYRISEHKIILEGYRLINHAIYLGKNPVFIAYREDFLERFRDSDDDIVLDRALFDMVSETVNSQGVIAVFDMSDIGKKDVLSNHIVVINAVQDPGNLGTIIRTCDSFGFDRLILTKGTADPYSDKCLRSTLSSIFSVNMTIGMASCDVVNYVKNRGFEIVVSSLDASTYIEDMKKCEKMAIVFGNEANGVSDDFYSVEHREFKINMTGSQESLNVAVAAGIT